jgi:hypothetical protein
MLRLTEDANETVAEAARAALIAIGTSGGAIALARSLHRLPPELRYRRFEEIRTRDRQLGDRVDRMMRQEELMSAEGEELTDDSPMVRASEEGLEWEVLTGPSSSGPRPPRPEAARGDPPDA